MKPSCQANYVQTYPLMLQPIVNTVQYRQFHYQMRQNVNGEIQKVLNALAADPKMAANTIVIFTSDHGEMLRWVPRTVSSNSGEKVVRRDDSHAWRCACLDRGNGGVVVTCSGRPTASSSWSSTPES